MRGTRWLLLVAIAVILSGIVIKYRAQQQVRAQQAVAKPASLPEALNSSAEHFEFNKKNGAAPCPIYHIEADGFEQSSDSSHVELKNVTLKLYNKSCTGYDLSRSAAATFFANDNRLYSEGEAEITLNLPLTGQPKHTPISVKSSGITVDTMTGRADTDRATTFQFERGSGKAVGAFYDPPSKELKLKSAVEVNWTPEGPHAKPLKIEGSSLAYHEATNEVDLSPWGKLTRDNTQVEGEEVAIHLDETRTGDDVKRVLKQVHAVRAHGVETYPNRKVQYAADDMLVDFDPSGVIQKITGQNNAHLVSTTLSAETTVDANHVDLDFTVDKKESILNHVAATGNGVVNSRPLPVAGHELGQTHVLRSENLEMKMRPGGHEMENVVTHGPGTLEFLPNAGSQHKRVLNGTDLLIAYAPQNRIENFHASNVKTQTEPTADENKQRADRKQPARVSALTTSRELTAHFDPKTSKMTSMEQTGDFTYVEADRNARAQKATLDDQNLIVLDSGARMWDATGSTTADRIRMDQRTGDFTADGNVNSSRLPDKDSGKSAQMLSGDEPLQAQAHRMVSTNRNRTIHYDGGVVMWQGANRLTADVVDLDRQSKKGLVADGHVVNNLWETAKDDTGKTDAKKKAGPAVLTVVKAPHLIYTDENRLAYYSGGVDLNRPGMHVTSTELRAFLAESGSDSRLDKAYADGNVQIVNTAKGHTRTGTGDHSEYYTGEQKVVLKAQKPKSAKLVDTVNGAPRANTEGVELTYYANDDRLLVNGGPSAPVETRIQKKKK
ncbi:MAG TPA: LPS export ABC transporter periplasmic protein LptC [Candidatus Sulfopaludibacter sp.]|jgi:lipopolysaccharide export system protein LptA|nr:LPS export ABC transporter periplasmic protein LptC [Candidatus Sulfopaludibacter sp.]